MKPFVYNGQPGRVVFGAGALSQLGKEIETLGARRALVLSTPEQRASAERIADMLGARAAGVFDRAVMHVPIETAREAREVARKLDADCAVAVGGGSTTGLGKAIALESGLPILAIPTTYAGSEMTPIFGITEAGLKKTGKDPKVLPRTVIYDPELTLTLPVGLSVTSGINAIAHAAEGLYSVDGNPIMDLMAEDGIRSLGLALPAIKANPTTSRRAARPCTAPGCAAWCWATSAWRCTTSCATRWAAASTCRTPRPTPSCCRMRWPTTPQPPRRPCSASRARWVAPVRRRPCTTWRRPTGRRWR
jgi:alcohol dehydrogenase class IV